MMSFICSCRNNNYSDGVGQRPAQSPGLLFTVATANFNQDSEKNSKSGFENGHARFNKFESEHACLSFTTGGGECG
jgi:hypothetical protein